MRFTPSYISLYQNGKLDQLIKLIESKYCSCNICPHSCNVDRINSAKRGFCKSGFLPVISSYGAHFGEEPPLVGHFGSGTIFFTNCNMRCVYCQNYEISQLGAGHEISFDELATIMIKLQNDGCHNINFVSPTHQILAILKALQIAIQNGLNIPLVYNSGGYDSVKTLQILNGIFDIYMPDFKYFDNQKAHKYSGIKDYVDHVKASVLEIYKQVGDLKTENGLAYRGLLIRHLVLPGNLADTDNFLDFIKEEFPDGIHLNIMNQYRPEYKAEKFEELNLKPSKKECMQIVKKIDNKKIKII
ncbi:MAG: radical SAM protein [Bacteroidales bacterium]